MYLISPAWSYFYIIFKWMNQSMTIAGYSYVKKSLFHIFGGCCGRVFRFHVALFFEKIKPTQSVGKTSNSFLPWPLFHLGTGYVHQYKADQLRFLLIPFIVSGILLWNQFLPAFSTRVIYLGLVVKGGYYFLKFIHIVGHCRTLESYWVPSI